MDTSAQVSQAVPGRGHRGTSGLAVVLGVLGGALGMLALVVVSRFVTADLMFFTTVTQRSCSGGLCAERVHRPDLVLVPGFREIRIGHDTPGAQGRYYVQADPFDDHADVTIDWNADGGVGVGDESATLTWSGDTLSRLDD
jgi:hypothetical protein